MNETFSLAGILLWFSFSWYYFSSTGVKTERREEDGDTTSIVTNWTHHKADLMCSLVMFFVGFLALGFWMGVVFV